MNKSAIALILCSIICLSFCGDAAPTPQCCTVIGSAGAGAALSTTSLSFGNVTIDQVSAAQAVTLTSSGTSSLSVTAISISAKFSLQAGGTCATAPFTLPPGGSCTFSIAFSPTAVGAIIGSLVITDNASPPTQAVTLSGNGVAAPGCGNAPLASYSARTDTTVQTFPGTIPVAGAAGWTYHDSRYDTASYSDMFLRVTDTNTGTAAGVNANVSFHASAGGDGQTWACDDSRLFTTPNNQGAKSVIFTFNTTAFSAAFDRELNTIVEPSFSRSDPNILYAWASTSGTPSLATDPNIRTYNFSTGAYSVLFNIPTACTGIRTFTTSDTIGLIRTAKNSSAEDYRILVVAGVQQAYDEVIIYDTILGCRWYDPKTGDMGGAWGPSCSACQAIAPSGLHNATLSFDGTAVDTSAPGGNPANAIWTINSTSIAAFSTGVGGHRAWGTSDLGTPNANSNQWMFFNDATPLTLVGLGTRANTNDDEHMGWNNANSADTSPYCAMGDVESAGAVPTQAQSMETICIQTNAGASGVVWRFGQGLTNWHSFWYGHIGTVSDDGRYYQFTSSWQDTLGTDNTTDSTGNPCGVPVGQACPRFDVWILRLF